MMELTKEDYLKAAEIMAGTRPHNVTLTAQLLSLIFPIEVVGKMNPIMTPEEIEIAVKSDGRPVREIADEMGVSKNTIYRYMSGERRPDKDAQEKLLEVLNCLQQS